MSGKALPLKPSNSHHRSLSESRITSSCSLSGNYGKFGNKFSRSIWCLYRKDSFRTPSLSPIAPMPVRWAGCRTAMKEVTTMVESPKSDGRKLVVAVNDTVDSWHAVKWTLTHIYREGDVLHLVHCIPKNSSKVPLPATFLANSTESMDYEDMLSNHAYEFINHTMLEMASSMKAACKVDILHVGDSPRSAGEAVCRYSEALGATLVVIAQQRKNLAEELLTGGCMSKYALEECKQPTLIYQASMAMGMSSDDS